MLTSPDCKELLKLFEKYDVRYLVIGGYAVMKYTEPRFTKDIDLLIAPDIENAAKVYRALKEFGAPLVNLTPTDFTDKDSFYQMGRAPLRVDILMSTPGIHFDTAWENREVVTLPDLTINFISRNDLIQTKIALGRPQDLIDVEKLRLSQRLEASE